MRLRWMVSVLACLMALVVLPASVFAGTMRLRAEIVGAPGSGIVITDDNLVANGDLNAMLGALLIGPHDLAPGLSILFVNGTSKPLLPTAEGYLEQVSLNSLVVSNTRAGVTHVRLTIEDTGYEGGVSDKLFDAVGGTITGSAVVTSQSWANTSNVAPDLGNGDPNVDQTTATVLDPIVMPVLAPGSSTTTTQVFSAANGNIAAGGSFSGSTYESFVTAGMSPYALYAQLNIYFDGAGTVSFAHDTLVTPEPGSLLLFGTGLLGLARMARRRRALPQA